ncbi:MAG TPA: chromate resistance protein ChrB domain-containing protein [Gemmatimonadaceae bacterium]
MTKPRNPGRARKGLKPTQRKAAPPAAIEPLAARWLLLIHQIPPKPDYLRVKIGRRLLRVGAVAIKNSVYALPLTSECYEDFQWIVREIVEAGGDAFISEASLVGEGLTDEAVRARFDAARNEEYRSVATDAQALLKAVRQTAKKSRRSNAGSNAANGRPAWEHELAKLRRRYEAVSNVDFFGAPDKSAVAEALSDLERTIRQHGATARNRSSSRVDSATWVTRRDVHVDRIASGWLISRFIDRRPRFRFVDPKRHVHRDGELRFDMFEAEYTHVGDACTFETLVKAFVPNDAALGEIAEIVHDVDCKDAKFRRDEAPGLARMIVGIAALCRRDEDRLERGGRLFDDLYAAFGGKERSALGKSK